jgi:hypothetical protein
MMRGHLSSWIEEISTWQTKQTNKQPSLTSGYPWPSNTVKSPGFFKPGSCLSFFLETFILQDYMSFSSSSSSIIFFFQDEELGWWDGWRDGWMERTTTTGQNQGYYIRRWIDLHTYIDTWVESSYTSAYHYKKKSKDLLFVSCVHVSATLKLSECFEESIQLRHVHLLAWKQRCQPKNCCQSAATTHQQELELCYDVKTQ